MTRLTPPFIALLAASTFAQSGGEGGAKPKLAIVPFAVLTGDVAERTGTKALGMLSTEIKNADAFELMELSKDKSPSAPTDALEPARKAVSDGKSFREKRKFRLAEEALQSALKIYRTQITEVDDIGEIVDCYALLAAVQYNTGRDDEGAQSLRQALTLAPDRELPLAQTSALFARVVTDMRKVIKEAPKGSLLIDSSPANAPVLLDGVAVGSTPLLVKEVPVGLHFFRLALPSQERLGGTIDVTAQKQANAKVASANKAPEMKILASLAQNRLDGELVTALGEYSKSVDSRWVLFGGLSKHGKGLALDTFLFSRDKSEVRRMARTTFDAELLSAGMEFYSLVGELAKKGEAVGEAVQPPASVSPTLMNQGAPQLTEVKFGASSGKDAVDALEPGSDDGPKKPVEPKRRAPLKQK